MKPMKYFIGCRVRGEAGQWHFALARELEEKFGLKNTSSNVESHVTLYYLDELDNARRIRQYIEEYTSSHPVGGELVLSGFGRFDNEVIFASVHPDQTVYDWVTEFKKALALVPGVIKESFPIWHPHLTLGEYGKAGARIEEAWSYLGTLPKPSFTMPFNHIALYEYDGARWNVDMVFPLIRPQ